MSKNKFKKVASNDNINEVLYGSTNYVQTEVIDRKAINTAIARCIMPYDWKIEEYSCFQAAQDVFDELLEAGFPKISRKWSIISQGNVKFKVCRPENNMDVFVALGEKTFRK